MEETRAATAAAADDEVKIHKERGLKLNGLREVSEKADKIVDYCKDNDPFYDRAISLSEE
jgi:hypothetical protein